MARIWRHQSDHGREAAVGFSGVAILVAVFMKTSACQCKRTTTCRSGAASIGPKQILVDCTEIVVYGCDRFNGDLALGHDSVHQEVKVVCIAGAHEQPSLVVVQAGLDDMVLREYLGREPGRLIAANQ